MTENIEELQQLHSSWKEQKYTQTFLKHLKLQLRDAWVGLQSSLAQTTDPKVMYAYSRWWMLSECITAITKGPEDDQRG